MKIGILTHYNVSSHGAILQMYALQEELKANGHDVFILTYNRNLDFVDKDTKKRFSASIKNLPYYLSSYVGKDGVGCLFYQRKKQKILERFKEKHFKMIPYTDSGILDCVIVGADEVFALENGINIMMFGHCITAKRIIAYAPSAGQTNMRRIEDYGCKEIIQSGLSRFNALSARDNGTKMIIDELTGQDVPIVCDPALLYKFSHPNKYSKKKYIVVYSYQSNFKDQDRISKIKKYAKKNGCELWSVGVYYKWCDKQINCDPLEMISVFANAEVVITDTFHGTITSYIAHTPMAVYVREDNNVKLDFLLKAIGIQDRKVNEHTQIDSILEQEIDFDQIDKNVEAFRRDSHFYLEKALITEE